MQEQEHKEDARAAMRARMNAVRVAIALFAVASLWGSAWTLPAEASPQPRGFFPIGLYCVDDPEDFREIAGAGFNLVQGYALEGAQTSEQTIRRYLDAAHQSGLRVLAGIPQEFVDRGDLRSIRKRVLAFKRHPAVFAWQLYDEPESVVLDRSRPLSPRRLRQAYRTIKRADPSRPVSIAASGAFDPDYPYLDGADRILLQYGPYPAGLFPFPYDSISHIGGFLDPWIRDLTAKGKSFILAVSVYNVANDALIWPKDDPNWPRSRGRYPTKEEIRFMSYAYFIHGGRNVIFNCYRFDYGEGLGGDDISRKNNPAQWEAVSSVSLELKAMGRVLLVPNLKPSKAGVALEGNAALEMAVKVYKGRTYLLTANTSANPVEGRITLAPAKFPAPQVKHLPDQTSVAVEGGSFAPEWEAYGVHVYKIASGR